MGGNRQMYISTFLSTLSLRRATPVRDVIQWEGMIFYPRSPCGERLLPTDGLFFLCAFLSTLSLRRATSITPCATNSSTFSIHALLAESDLVQIGRCCIYEHFSIHALLAESDFSLPNLSNMEVIFLSTLSLRRAT